MSKALNRKILVDALLNDIPADAIFDGDTLKLAHNGSNYIIDLETNGITHDLNYEIKVKSLNVWYSRGVIVTDAFNASKLNNVECFGTYAVVELFNLLEIGKCLHTETWTEWFDLVNWLSRDIKSIEALKEFNENFTNNALNNWSLSSVKALIKKMMQSNNAINVVGFLKSANHA